MLRCFGVIVASLIATGCESTFSHHCTLIGCEDGAQITLRTPDNRWPSGAYAFDFTLDGEAHACTLRIPDDLPQDRARIFDVPCEPELGVMFMPKTVCHDERFDGAVSQHCAQIDGEWLLEAYVEGVIESLRVNVRRDETTLLDRALEPEYVAERPNGPDCEPICNQARVELTLE